MDPQVVLFNLLEAIRAKDRDEAVTLMTYLIDWFEDGGFMPQVGCPVGLKTVSRKVVE